MGALREKMIEEMKLRNFASRTQKSYVAAMVGLAKALSSIPGSTHSRADPYLSVASARPRLICQFAERGDLGATVFLSASFGLEPRTAVFAAEKKNVAIAGGVKSQRSRAIAERYGQAQRSLFTDNRLLSRASGKRTGPSPTQRHRSRTYDDPRGAGQGKKKTATRFSPNACSAS